MGRSWSEIAAVSTLVVRNMRFHQEVLLLFLAYVVLPSPWHSTANIKVVLAYSRSPTFSSPFTVHSDYGTALMLPLSSFPARSSREHHMSQHARALVSNARMNLHDDLRMKGYYTTRLYIGSPPQKFAVIVDTGSTVTYVPCSSCTHCGAHQDPQFRPEFSKSYQSIHCGEANCTGTCDRKQQCRYSRHYAEQSSSSGLLGRDLVGFGNDSLLTPRPILFGCETVETGDIYWQQADGIMGLGRGALSIVDQLTDQGAIANSFSLCYGGMEEAGGAMILGAVPPLQGTVFTPSNPYRSNYYNLLLREIWVERKPLLLEAGVFDGGYGTILDSGTTYAYLPAKAFNMFSEAVAHEVKNLKEVEGPDENYHDICYSGAGENINQLSRYFPSVDFLFGDNQAVPLAPENYLFKHTKVRGAYCLGFFKNQDETTLLGAIMVRNMLVTYDRVNDQIGFLRTRCTDLWSSLPAASMAGRVPPGGPVMPASSPASQSTSPLLGFPANTSVSSFPVTDYPKVHHQNDTDSPDQEENVTSDSSPALSPLLSPSMFGPSLSMLLLGVAMMNSGLTTSVLR